MRHYGPSAAELGRICAATGCELRGVEQVFDGTPAYNIECHTVENKVRLLATLAEYDARTADVRRLAERVAQLTKGEPWPTICALHAAVRDSVRHIGEVRETFSPTMRTLELGIGDCDDSARALMALLRALGFKAGLRTLGTPPKHVACVVWHDGAWRWLETTIQAYPGEHPIAARDRLKPRGRSDL